MVILMTYQYYMGKQYPKNNIHISDENAQPIATQEVTNKPLVSPASPASPALPPASLPASLPASVVPEDVIRITSGNYTYTFTNRGGAIKKVTYGDLVVFDAEDLPLRLMSIRQFEENFQINRTANGVRFVLLRPDGLSITKEYNLTEDGQGFNLAVTFMNQSSNAIQLQYDICAGTGVDLSNPMDKRYIEANSIIDGKIARYKKYKDLAVIQSGTVSIVGLRSKYFSSLLKLIQPGSSFIAGSIGDVKRLTSLVGMPPRLLSPGISIHDEYFCYIGPNDSSLVAGYGLGLEKAIDYGRLRGLEKLLRTGLKFYHSITHNWGMAIILLTLTISLLLYPFTSKSIHSMHKMQVLQPKIAQLREELKSDPQRLNIELMNLYKKEKVNPLGGCLPMLFQMPVFIAFYQTLFKFMELNGAGFLWIKDLSAPDRMPLPFSLPVLGNSINVLPLAMAAMTFIQQKTTSMKRTVSQPYHSASDKPAADPQQQMAVIMPILFGVLFYKLPSGLVLYWFTNTTIMFVHQLRLRKTL